MVHYPKLARLGIYWLVLLVLTGPVSLARGVQRTVLLTNGNVIQGDVQQLSDHVVVSSQSLEVRVPNSDVELVALDLPAVYRAKAAAITGKSSKLRTQLVRWCLRNGLPAQAEEQLSILRQISPKSSDLEHLSREVHSYRGKMKTTTLPAKTPLPLDRQYAQDRLDQLSKETVSDFVRSVQPLLTNRCGLAGCHGKASKSNFSLLSVGAQRPSTGTTHGNLGAVLQQLSGAAPQQTLLWMSANSAHGDLRNRPMSEAELRHMAAWIQRVHDELGQEPNSQPIAQSNHDATIGEAVDPFAPEEFNSATAATKSANSQSDDSGSTDGSLDRGP